MRRWRTVVVFLALLVAATGMGVGISHSYADTADILSTLDKLKLLGSVTQTSGGSVAGASVSQASLAQQDKDTLQKQIDDRNSQLTQIQQQLDATKKVLGTTQSQRKSLQGQVAQLENNIKTLQLGIQADTLTIQKLGFEIQNLNGDVATLRGSMEDKQATIAVLMREMQKAENSSPLITFLQTKNLSAGIQEAQAVSLLQQQLTTNLTDLRTIHENVVAKLNATDDKKQQISDRQKDLQNQKLIVQDQQKDKATVLAQTKNQESAYQQQVSDLEAQQKKIAAEIEAIDAVLRGKINQNVLPDTGHGVLGTPVQDGLSRVTQGYGYTAFAKNGYQGHRHNGIDFGGPIGTPVYAAEAGTIVAAANEDAYCPRGAYGKFVAINHTNGLSTVYGHLSRWVVSAGQQVVRGELIGYSGMTGYATGPHLHFGVYAQSTFYVNNSPLCGPLPHGGDVNPLNYL